LEQLWLDIARQPGWKKPLIRLAAGSLPRFLLLIKVCRKAAAGSHSPRNASSRISRHAELHGSKIFNLSANPKNWKD